MVISITMQVSEILSHVDHTQLKAFATWEDIQKLCERIIIINNGEIVTDDSMMEIRRKYFTKKIIKLRTNCEVNFVAKEGIDILKREEEYLKLSLDLKCLNVTDIFHLIPENEISDISVSDVSLESVIKEIYQSN